LPGNMVEYLRLIKPDSFTGIAEDWHRPEVLVIVGILGALILLGYLIAKK